MMTEWLALLVPPLAAGMFGSAHCVAMCGGLSGLFAMRAGARATQSRPTLGLAYNAGRLGSYALLGALVALAGEGLAGQLPGLVLPLRLLAALVIILMGLQIAFGWRLLAPIELAGGRIWRLVAPHAQALLPADTVGKASGLGLAWGLLPCGLVYSMLIVAMASADPLAGAAIMLAFGLGTMPAMLVTGLGAWKLSALLSSRRQTLAAGLLLVMIGTATAAMPVVSVFDTGDHGHRQHSHH